ncbi:hypothetical protein GCM10023200_06950 [Actinomycetospora chlora]|uniref:DUF4190 domain-containing protein n=1 Tax=Actinomycetospora chlora TaxID=663608 RepID=A0ABP9A9X8_9PSEU
MSSAREISERAGVAGPRRLVGGITAMSSSFAPPPAPQQPYLPPPPRPNGGLATGGFVVALVGAVLALIPILGIVSWVLSPLGLVLSLVGLNRIPRGQGRGLGTAGAILGAVGLLICMLWASAFSNAVSSRSGTPSYSSSSSSSSSYPSYSAAAPATTSAMPSVNGPFGNGTYLVGSELAAGTYRTDGSGGSCYWERLRDTSGEFSAIIANDAITGPSTMTVRSSDQAVHFSGDCTWTRR